jgi:hypothetical protein
MEFDIDIHTGLNGKITIEDYSQEYDQYFPEDQAVQEYGRYKYSESKTLNVIMKVNSGEIKLVDVLLHSHDQLEEDPTTPGVYLYGVEKTDFRVVRDGYYNVHHIVLPTLDWYTNTYLKQTDDYRAGFDSVYIIHDDNKLYKLVDDEFVECTVKEIVARNHEGTTIEKCIIDVFYTGFLQMCYINYCRQLFQKLTKGCNYTCAPEDTKNITYIRDFLWMVLNVIDYQISFKQYMEAQRVLEMTNHCGSFCQNQELNAGPSTGCGCSKN